MHIHCWLHFSKSNCSFSAEAADNQIYMFSLKKQNILFKKKIKMLTPTLFFTFCPSKFEPGVKKQQGEGCVRNERYENLLSHHGTVSLTAKWFLLLLKRSQTHVSPAREKPKRGNCLTGVNVTRPCKETVLIHLVLLFFFPFLEQKEQQFGLL